MERDAARQGYTAGASGRGDAARVGDNARGSEKGGHCEMGTLMGDMDGGHIQTGGHRQGSEMVETWPDWGH